MRLPLKGQCLWLCSYPLHPLHPPCEGSLAAFLCGFAALREAVLLIRVSASRSLRRIGKTVCLTQKSNPFKTVFPPQW